MTTPFAAKAAPQIRTDILRTTRTGFIARGVPNPNVGYGSDDYIRADAIASQLEALSAGAIVAADQTMPDSAVSADLVRVMAIFGLAPRQASTSAGRVIFSTSATTLVPTNAQLTDPNGNQLVVATGGAYNNGDSIPLASVSTGQTANLAGGTTLKWVNPPAFAATTAILDSNGMTGGTAADTDDTARARLLAFLQNPPGGGNAVQIATAAESAGAFIQKAFTYPACNGPGTVHVAVAGPAVSSSTRSRQVTSANVALATSAVQAMLPEFVELVLTSVVDSPVDVAFKLQLPSSVNAIPAGTGGGWLDGAPWPQVTGSTPATVSSVTSSTSFSVAGATAAPVVGQRICFVDKTTFTLYQATILTQSGAGPYAVTIDTPFPNLANGDFIFPASTNQANYIAAILAQFAAMGPYEKTAQVGLLPWAYRRPRWFESWPYALGGQFLKALTNCGPEVYDAQWVVGNAVTLSPPGAITSGPSIFIPRRLAIYPE